MRGAYHDAEGGHRVELAAREDGALVCAQLVDVDGGPEVCGGLRPRPSPPPWLSPPSTTERLARCKARATAIAKGCES